MDRWTVRIGRFSLCVLLVAGCRGENEPSTPTDLPDAVTATQAIAPQSSAPALLLMKADGVAESRGMRVELKSAFVVWHSSDRSLRIKLYPFALTDKEQLISAEESTMASLHKQKGNPNPSVWGNSLPYVELVLRFQEDAETFDETGLQDVRVAYTDFDASPNVSSSQAFVRPESEYIRELAISGTAKGDAVRLVFATPEGTNRQEVLNVAIDAMIAVSL